MLSKRQAIPNVQIDIGNNKCVLCPKLEHWYLCLPARPLLLTPSMIFSSGYTYASSHPFRTDPPSRASVILLKIQLAKAEGRKWEKCPKIASGTFKLGPNETRVRLKLKIGVASFTKIKICLCTTAAAKVAEAYSKEMAAG